jgi:ATP-binding cassette subfamily B protein
MDIAPEVLIGVAVDIVVQREQSFLARLGLTESFDQLLALAALTLVIWFLESLFQYLYEVDWRGLAQSVQHDLRLEAYGHVQQLDVSYFEDRNAGSLVSVLNDDVNQLERFLDGGAASLIQTATTCLLVGAIFFYLAPSVAVWAMLPIPVIIAGAWYYEKKADPLYASVRAKAAAVAGKLAANLDGVTTIKSQTAEALELAKVRHESLAYMDANRRAIRVSAAFIPLIRMAILAGFTATLLIGGRLVLDGEIAVGSYGVLVFLTQRLLWPFTRLAQTVDLYQRARASTARILQLLALPVKPVDRGVPLAPDEVKGDVRFDSISFGYKDRPPLFSDLNLHVPAGASVALVGATGSGKSTIAKLLLRFYEPTAGRITLDGYDVHEVRATDLRRVIGFVSQDVFLFDGSVRENIAYGAFEATDLEVEAAAKIADAHEFIARLPEGYATRIGDRGLKLSGGQRQRLAIARAVLKDPRIMVLDEATSAVDNESERLIQKALRRVAVGRTTLMIAHRLSTVRHCDVIYVLDHGRIVEAGTHDELLGAGGVYAMLWAVQTGAMLEP